MRRSAGKVRPLSNAFAGDELLPALVPEKEKPHQVSDMVLAAIYAALPKVNTVETIEAAAVKAGLKDTSSIARHLKVVAWSGGAITFRQFATVLRLGSHQAKLSDKEVLEYLETFEALGGGVAGGGKVQANDIEMCAQGFGLSIGSSVAAGSALDFISFCDVVHASEDFSNGPSCQPQSSTSRESFPATPPKPTSAVGDVAPPSTTTSDRAQTGNRLQIKQAVRRIANLISTLKQDGAESTDHHANSISDSFSLPPDTPLDVAATSFDELQDSQVHEAPRSVKKASPADQSLPACLVSNTKKVLDNDPRGKSPRTYEQPPSAAGEAPPRKQRKKSPSKRRRLGRSSRRQLAYIACPQGDWLATQTGHFVAAETPKKRFSPPQCFLRWQAQQNKLADDFAGLTAASSLLHGSG